MTEREKLMRHLESNGEIVFEDIICSYIKANYSEFTASRLNEMISILSNIVSEKIAKNETAIDNAIQYSLYIKSYLEGKMYTSKEIAEAHVDIQIDHINKIIDYCKDSKE